jgi:phosphomannomutase
VQSMTTKEIKVTSFNLIKGLIESPGIMFALKGSKIGTLRSTELNVNAIRFNTLVGKAAAAGVSLHDLARKINSPDILNVLKTEEDKYKDSEPLKGITMVVEGFNTPSGKLAEKTFVDLGATVKLLHPDIVEVEGKHKADPANDENLQDLRDAIKETHAAFGIAFDLDGDRGAIVVPEWHQDGTVTFTTLTPDNLIVALLEDLVNQWGYNKANIAKDISVIRDVLGTYAVNDKAAELNAQAEQTDAGYVFLKERRENLTGAKYVVPIYGER